jgi:Domain of unknown function (DUF1918)
MAGEPKAATVRPGVRIIIASQKTGHPQRTGTVLLVVGRMLSARWDDGSESLFTPGAGSLRVAGPTSAPRSNQ